jgi:hypothetical protein
MPAWNAAATIGEAMASVVSQTLAEWELIVVDDGSTDETLSIARGLADAEPRCRVLALPNGGVGAARNRGVMASAAPWVVFLDSDDWLLPGALASFMEGAAAHPEAGAIVGGWSRVTSDGTVTPNSDDFPIEEMFDVAARYCPFAIHAAAVRREDVLRAGAFDPAFRAGGDWDFWQRLARTGARFSRIGVEVARYRTRPNSIVMHPEQMLDTGLRIIDCGHGPDPRVAHPDPRFAAGRDPARRSSARIAFAVWPAAMLLGMGRNLNVVLQRLEADEDPDLDPRAVASSLYTAALLPSSSPPAAWRELYPRLADPVGSFLHALEATSGTVDLATRTLRELECRIALLAGTRDLIRVGATAAVGIELTRPIDSVEPGEGCHRLYCEFLLEGVSLGRLELPVSDGVVPAGTLADSVAAEHGWRILGVFLARTIYPGLHVSLLRKGRVRRGVVPVGPAPTPGTSRNDPTFHDLVGWSVFLQELWGKPRWPEAWFYRSGSAPHDPPSVPTGRELMQFEVSESDRWIATTDPVLVTVGGAPLLAATLPARYRARIGAVTTQGGYELCRLAVREGLLGQSLDGGPTLRARLSRAAERRRNPEDTIGDRVAT